MPRPRLPARIYMRPDTGQWTIIDGRDNKSRLPLYGYGARGEAELALSKYIAQKGLPDRLKPGGRDEVLIGEALARYFKDRSPHIQSPESLRYAIQSLSPYWSNEPVSAVKGSMCRAYQRYRKVAPGTVRRELGVLQAALNHAEKEGILESAPKVSLPQSEAPRDRWLTTEEYARLIEHAAPHVHRFAWIAVATGTRADAITKLRWVEGLDAGWINTETGTLYRAGAGEARTKKRRDGCRLPEDLLEACREWRQDGSPYVIHRAGEPVKDIRTAFEGAVRRAGLEGVTRHTLKHTAVTWAMQRGMRLEKAAEFFSTSGATLHRVYQSHHPEFTADAASLMRMDEGNGSGNGSS